VLTLDLGNTNASLALADPAGAGDAPVQRLLAAGSGRDLAWIDEAAKHIGAVDVAAISAVGAEACEDEAAALLARFAPDVRVRPAAGLTMAIRNPETCGFDRQYAMRAALEAARAAGRTRAIAIDAGTALTVDAGALRGGAPTFLGGAIAVGPGTAADALTRSGARLPRFELTPVAPALGRSTPEALAAGVAVGFRGAVRELAREVAREAFGGAGDVHVSLTGGARAFAEAALDDLGAATVVTDPLLVHRGLWLACAV